MNLLMLILQVLIAISCFFSGQLAITIALIYLGICIFEFYKPDGNRESEVITKR